MITAQIARRHAERLADSLDEATRQLLCEHPLDAVTDLLGLTVHTRPPSETPTGCPVDGSYNHRTETITIAESRSHGRRHFSLLHELGHRLITLDEDDELGELLWDHPQAAEWTEVICDAIAAELLLPATLVGECIGEAGPTAEAVVELHDRSAASREACAVRAAQRVGAPGYVVVADLDGTVRFAARASTPYQVARGTRQDELHPLTMAGRNGASRQSDVTLTFRSGAETDPHHADCIRDGEYVFGVFTTGRPAWPLPGVTMLRPAARETPTYFCGRCQDEYSSWEERCAGCGDRPCPTCGWCSCKEADSSDLVPCRSCTVSWPADHIEGGLCRDCR